jgi:tetratricopeptide (TPR) repeat protein
MAITRTDFKTVAGLLCAMLTLATAAGCRQQSPVPDGLLAEAAEELQSGDADAARLTLQAAAEANPDSLTAQVNLGLACLQLDDLTAAIAALNRATELAPDQPAVWEILGHLLIRTGNSEGASEVLSRVSTPTEVTLTLRAMAARQAGNPDGALLYLEQALKKNRDYPPALYNMAVLHRDSFNAPVEALAAYRLFRDADPDNPRAAVSNDAFLKSARPEQAGTPAIPAIPDVIREPPPMGIPYPAPNAAPAVTPPPPTPAPAPAAAATPSRLPPAAAPVATPAAVPAAAAPPPAGTVPSAQSLIRKADAEINAGNNDAALVTLKTAVQHYPDSADAVWALAVFYDKQLGLKDRADGLYKTFLHMFPEDRRAKLPRTAAKAPRQENTAEATGESFFRKGLEHYSRQEWDAAIAAYRQALSLDPKSASCAYNLGLAYKAKEDLDAAVAAFRHALNLEPDMIKALYMLGLTEIHRHRHADALPPLNRLISIQPDFAKAHYLLGTVYQAENRPDTAAFHFERFLKLEPTDSAAPQVRRWMQQNRR